MIMIFILCIVQPQKAATFSFIIVIHFVQYLDRTLTFFCFPPLFLGVIVASALIDISQQKPTDFKDKSLALKNRKALPPAHQGTCV